MAMQYINIPYKIGYTTSPHSIQIDFSMLFM